ncbi:MAG: hypothetical protein MHM6MM_005720 [Cercozoa sp. M6MM]
MDSSAKPSAEPDITLADAVTFVFLVGGQLLPYVKQYGELRAGRGQGFSTMVPLVLIACNTLRVLFWIGEQFEAALLVQSIVMILAMWAMMHALTQARQLSLLSYLAPWLLACLVAYPITVALSPASPKFVSTLGYLALGSESLLALPQYLQNRGNRSTAGLEVSMPVIWLVADLAKTALFVLRASPLQFVLCGLMQVTLDCAILGQIVAFASLSTAPQDTNARIAKRLPAPLVGLCRFLFDPAFA